MPSMMKRPYRTRGRICDCSDCQGTHGRYRAREKRQWRAEAKTEALYLRQDHDDD